MDPPLARINNNTTGKTFLEMTFLFKLTPTRWGKRPVHQTVEVPLTKMGTFFHEQTQHNSDLVLCKSLPIGFKDHLIELQLKLSRLTFKGRRLSQPLESFGNALKIMKIGIFSWKDWKVGTTPCCWIMVLTKREWNYSSHIAVPVSISIYIFSGWYHNCAWRFCRSFNVRCASFLDHTELGVRGS